MMKITEFDRKNQGIIQQAAGLLYNGFKENWPDAWPDMESALREVKECINPERICRMAINDNRKLAGWIGAISMHKGNAWELHPVVVDKECRNIGIGRNLVLDLENEIKKFGGHTIFLGTDDENNMTSLSGTNLYDNLWEKISTIKNYKNHPYSFYQKLGFSIIGVIPDANGIGKPDILMAKKVL